MKKFLKLIPAICMLMVATILVSTATYAWFSMNRTVTATGMSVQAKADKSLVIANFTETAGKNPVAGVGTAVTVDFSTIATNVLLPSTHFKSSATYPASASSNLNSVTNGLTFVTNGGDVNASSGYAQSNKTLYYGDAVNSESDFYYYDFKVCIASSGGKLEGQTLTARIISPTADAIAAYAEPTLKAVSIDFYYSTSAASLGTYAGTLNVAGLNWDTNNGTAALTSLDIFNASATGGTIPVNNTTSEYLIVTMRVYVDGNLKQSTNNAFVNSDHVDLSAVNLGVSFTAETKSTSNG